MPKNTHAAQRNEYTSAFGHGHGLAKTDTNEFVWMWVRVFTVECGYRISLDAYCAIMIVYR